VRSLDRESLSRQVFQHKSDLFKQKSFNTKNYFVDLLRASHIALSDSLATRRREISMININRKYRSQRPAAAGARPMPRAGQVGGRTSDVLFNTSAEGPLQQLRFDFSPRVNMASRYVDW
jgi:hypothetical protein